MITQGIAQKILIIDDNPMNLLLTSKILESFGYEVAIAESGQNGIDLIDTFLPSLILLDISMPDMDGYEVCEIIKSKKNCVDIPIIFLTANTLTEDLIKGFEKGGVDYITKPFKREELNVRVKTHLELFESKKKIIGMNQYRDKLYSIIAHDIRSPLSGILQTLDAIDQGYFDPASDDFKELIHILRERTRETGVLLNSLLQWTRFQGASVPIKLINTNIFLILSNCILLLEANAKIKNIEIKLEVEENLIACCDEVSIHSVFRNILSNAIKFTPNDGKITVSASIDGGYVHIQISDTGIGMEDEKINKLMMTEEFITTSGTNNEHGTGLGLIIVRDFIKKNNSKLNISSSLGIGTQITVSLPGAT